MIDLVTAKLGRRLYEDRWVSNGSWNGLHNGSLGFCGEESAEHPFLRFNGSVWTTDKDAIVPALLSAEITPHASTAILASYTVSLSASLARLYSNALTRPPPPRKKRILAKLSPQQIDYASLAGEKMPDHPHARARK